MKLSEVAEMPEVRVDLAPGGRRRYWFVEVLDPGTGDSVCLPPATDWHVAVHLTNELAKAYGAENVGLYQWDIERVAELEN